MKAASLLPELSVHSMQSGEKSEYSWSLMQLLAGCQRGAVVFQRQIRRLCRLHPHSSLLGHAIPSVLVHRHLHNCIKIQAGQCLVQLSVGHLQGKKCPQPLWARAPAFHHPHSANIAPCLLELPLLQPMPVASQPFITHF